MKTEKKSKRRRSIFSRSKLGSKKLVNKAFHSVTDLEQKAKEPLDHQVMKLAEVIQQLQQRVVELELQIIPRTLQEEHDQ
jgi:vacuolar-type H+-ATPase subunit D/Vma8